MGRKLNVIQKDFTNLNITFFISQSKSICFHLQKFLPSFSQNDVLEKQETLRFVLKYI